MKSTIPIPNPRRSGYANDGADDPDTWLTANEVRQLIGGMSAMTLHRWLNNPALAFPVPARIQGKRYFRRREIIDWMTAQVREAS